jgi:hypothetical protein
MKMLGTWTVRLGAALLAAAAVPVSAAETASRQNQLLGPRNTITAAPVARAAAVRRSDSAVDSVRYWNEIANDAQALDHTPAGIGENRVVGEQLGPHRSARAAAIVHIAIFDSVNAITGGFRSYTGLAREPTASINAAVATAARDTLVQLYPAQRDIFNRLYAEDIARIPASQELAKNRGIALGNRAATRILGMRTNDGSQFAEPRYGVEYIPSNQPGHWRQDPISRVPLALGAFWNRVRPFVMTSAAQFRIPAPPALNSPAYTAAFNEIKNFGGDGVTTPTQRSAEQTVIGIYWGYDGTPLLGTPPRLYNQIALEISKNETSPIRLARLLALINVSIADAGIGAWESKFFWNVWRPITGVREADPGTGPTGAGDGNPATIGDPGFIPLGAPASNVPNGTDFTPPFPAYPSGHATFGGALFETLRNFYGTDNIAFTFVSDEFNGVTRDSDGNVRPLIPRSFNTLSQAEAENGQSRIYLGIHWQFDSTAGISQGRQIADFVFANRFQPAN